MKSFFTLPLAPWIWRPSATGFPWSCETWQVILRFVGQTRHWEVVPSDERDVRPASL
jgi:hypothetical protein